jgi:hypothetical protein
MIPFLSDISCERLNARQAFGEAKEVILYWQSGKISDLMFLFLVVGLLGCFSTTALADDAKPAFSAETIIDLCLSPDEKEALICSAYTRGVLGSGPINLLAARATH